MAFPQVQDRVTSEEGNAVTTHTITLPATINSGDLLVAFYHAHQSRSKGLLSPDGWTPVLWDVQNNDVHLAAFIREADGSEGSSITAHSAGAGESSHVVYRITGHESPSTQLPESVSFPIPSEYKQIYATHDNGFRCDLTAATRTNESDSEDPGIFTLNASANWAAATVSVEPSGGAFPVIEDQSVSLGDNVTTHTIDLPTGITSGELLIATFTIDGTETISGDWPVGWTEFVNVVSTNTRLKMAWRAADGSEGSSISLTTDTTADSNHTVYRISGAADPSTDPPESTTATGSSASADPPSHTPTAGSAKYLWIVAITSTNALGSGVATGSSTSPDPPGLTPTGGAKDYLWLAACGHRGGADATGAPTNYTNLQTISDFRVAIATAERQLNTSSEDPGTFTFSGSQSWVAQTLAIHPPDEGAGFGVTHVMGF